MASKSQTLSFVNQIFLELQTILYLSRVMSHSLTYYRSYRKEEKEEDRCWGKLLNLKIDNLNFPFKFLISGSSAFIIFPG